MSINIYIYIYDAVYSLQSLLRRIKSTHSTIAYTDNKQPSSTLFTFYTNTTHHGSDLPQARGAVREAGAKVQRHQAPLPGKRATPRAGRKQPRAGRRGQHRGLRADPASAGRGRGRRLPVRRVPAAGAGQRGGRSRPVQPPPGTTGTQGKQCSQPKPPKPLIRASF